MLDSKISVPRSSMTITIGSSHHFLFWARKAQNSLARLSPWDCGGSFLELVGCLGSRLAHARYPVEEVEPVVSVKIA